MQKQIFIFFIKKQFYIKTINKTTNELKNEKTDKDMTFLKQIYMVETYIDLFIHMFSNIS